MAASLLLVVWSPLTRADGESAGPVRPVMLVRPPTPSASATEILSRLRGELLSVGLSVDIAERSVQATSDGTSSRAWMERAAADRRLDAALDIIDGAAPAAVDIWIFSSASGRSEVTRVTAESGSATALERLSIRCVEVLRSILAERTLGKVPLRQEPATPEPPPTVAAPLEALPAPADGPRRLGLELGATLVTTLDSVAPSISPLLRANWVVGDVLALQMEGAALGSRAGFAAAGGSARLSQQFALAGVCACWPSSRRRLRPTFALSVGALHSAVTGQAEAPAEGHGLSAWSLLVQASAGVRVALAPRYELSLAAHAQFAQPYVVVYVVDQAVATVGRPGLGLSLTLGGWL
ncbi:MAG TPA: hypothetical protein VHU40_04760 [Polyangia bacterium]|nr:hypothetical protein [Polyangia bacterium]